MSLVTISYRFFLANVLSLATSLVTVFIIIVNFLKNPLSNPLATKLKLEPPAALSDPKYGVHKYIKANSVKLHYVDSGDPSKPLMLFIHGFPEFWYSWRHQITYFNQDYRCVAVDLRGYGDSEKPEGVENYKLEILVEDMKDLIQQLGYKKAIVVSHDWGGIIACQLRDTYPELVDAVIQLSSASLNSWTKRMWSTREQMMKSWYVFFFRIPSLPEIFLQMNDLEFFEKSIFRKKNNFNTDADLECYKYWFRKHMACTPPINYYRANFWYSWEEKKHEENVPFLAAHGKKEIFLSPFLLEGMKNEYTNIETAIIDGVGHFMQQESPLIVNEVIKDFLKKHNL